jgi:hypothetical protein
VIGGVWVEVIVNGEHLRLFSQHNALGVQTSVYNVTIKTWIAPSESVDDIEQGKITEATTSFGNIEHTCLNLSRCTHTMVSATFIHRAIHSPKKGEHI